VIVRYLVGGYFEDDISTQSGPYSGKVVAYKVPLSSKGSLALLSLCLLAASEGSGTDSKVESGISYVPYLEKRIQGPKGKDFAIMSTSRHDRLLCRPWCPGEKRVVKDLRIET
jgi:hypothetical protein